MATFAAHVSPQATGCWAGVENLINHWRHAFRSTCSKRRTMPKLERKRRSVPKVLSNQQNFIPKIGLHPNAARFHRANAKTTSFQEFEAFCTL
ncbi:hypothetical protein GOZ78_09720 [Agrobacterium vitis]|uniref:Transposase n=1 Tax=Agrobacterium vitis TaxID=373 RepID=A0ABD6G590_AGRVI|nr:hypothetical protein [Agrobacterium vitis]MCF1454601.1 hypothetical protein [Agrobacterium vitis]MUO78317.1 hypothetical protein [Agrobacterium vitis]MUO94194.1 hypothetical protein [Agrobacterium vitis]MUP03351.1 hypothetical protein [Agrobacterium vitis]MUZ84467.1 hypothetical protein [Agrobacterium vitis]